MTGIRQVVLREVAQIDRDIVDASAIDDGTLYVGLENIESGGRLVNVRPVDAGELLSSKYAFTARHMLYGKLRPYLAKIARPDFEGICSTDILPVLPGPDLDRDYLAWILLGPEMVARANSRATGANLPRLSPNALAELQIPLPPLQEQRRIAAILDKADALRAKRRVAVAHLDSLSQFIFVDMFGDPATNPNRFVTKPLVSLVREGDSINYGVIQPGDDVESGIPLIRVGDLIDGRVNHKALKHIAPSVEAAYKRSRLRGDEVLVSCVGSIGVVALADESEKGFNIARAVARVPVAEDTDRIFLASYLRTHYVQRYFTSELRTVSQPTLNIKQLSETQVALPPIELQREFSTKAAAVERIKTSVRLLSSALDRFISGLQYRAVRGEL